ncbi:MAG: hypothetical protein HY074_15290 [Deltaproteobacteria bacterium]|nr:hypothetical protein [Deltaproteobacteria bacterium]
MNIDVLFWVMFLAVAAIFLWRLFHNQVALHRIEQGTLPEFGTDTRRSLDVAGVRGEVHYRAARHGKYPSPSCLHVSVPAIRGQAFFISPQKDVDKTFEGLGLTGEVTLGNPELDARYFIASPNRAGVQALFSDPKAEAFFKTAAAIPGLDLIYLANGHLGIRLSPLYNPDNRPLDEVAKVYMTALAEFGESVRAQMPGAGNRSVDFFANMNVMFRSRRFKSWCSIPLIAANIAVWIAFAETRPLHVMDAIVVTGGVSLVIAALVLLALRRELHDLSLPGSMLGTALIHLSTFAVLIGASVGLIFNGRWDRSASHNSVLPIVSKSSRVHNKTRQYYIKVPSPDHPLVPGQDFLEFSLRQAAWQEVVPQRHRLSLDYHDGYFGIKWIKGYRVDKSEAAN